MGYGMARMRSSASRERTRALPALLVFVAVAVLTTAQAQMAFNEAPQLAQQVQAGGLPPVEERLPTNPRVVEPVETVGTYGGTWRNALVGGADGGWLQKTVLYDNLVRWNREWTEVIPNIAESFEVSEDAREYTFHLREGMRWSDGEPFSADDIMFWWEAVYMNEELSPATPANPLTVARLDEYTVRFTFERPEGLFLQNAATPGGWVYAGHPRHYLEQFHADYNPEGIDALVEEAGLDHWTDLFNQTVGADPRFTNTELPTLYAWVVTRPYDGTTTRAVFERNPYYWKVDTEGNQLPYLDSVVYDIFEDAQVLLLRAMAGEIDFIKRHINVPANRAVLFDHMEQGGYRLQLTIPSTMNTMVLALNLTHNDPVKREIFQNKDFRIGLSHALDRQEIIDLVYIGQGTPWQAAPPETSPLYNEQLATQYLEYDVELANEHLDRAFPERDAQGFRLGPDGNRISFAVEVVTAFRPEWLDILEVVQMQWREVGVDMQIRSMDRSLFYTRKEANEHDANVWQGDGGLDALLEPRWYFPFSHESLFAPAWAAHFNPGLLPGVAPEEPPAATLRQMELYWELQASPPERHEELMREILEIAAEEFYVIGISLPAPSYAIITNHFRNVPEALPSAWLYPSPAPTDPEQYFIEAGVR